MSNPQQLPHRLKRLSATNLHPRVNHPPGPENPRHGFEHLIHLRDDFLGYVADLKQRYGDCVHYRVGFTPVYQFTHPDQMQEILATKARAFRKTDRFHHILGPWIGAGLLLSDGDHWAQQRRIVQPAFHPQLLPAHVDAIVARTNEFIDSLGERVCDFTPAIGRFTTLITGDILFGVDLSDIADRLVTEIVAMQKVAYAGFTAPMPGRRSNSSTIESDQFQSSVEYLQSIVQLIIDRGRENPTGRSRLLSALLNVGSSFETRNQMSGDRQLRDEIAMLLLAGSATTAAAIGWSLYALAEHQQSQQRAINEVDRVLNGRSITSSDFISLKFTQQCVFEAWRLYPPAYTTARQTIEAVEIGDYQLQAGAQIHLPLFLTHRDPRWFADPLDFRPDRFATPAKTEIPNFAFIPFGAGPRTCIGGGLALMEATIVLATIMQQFRLELSDEQYQPELQPLISLHPRDSLRLRLIPRR